MANFFTLSHIRSVSSRVTDELMGNQSDIRHRRVRSRRRSIGGGGGGGDGGGGGGGGGVSGRARDTNLYSCKIKSHRRAMAHWTGPTAAAHSYA